MNSEIKSIIEKIEKCTLEDFRDSYGKKKKKLFINTEKKILIKVCESEKMQSKETCWQDMDVKIKDYIIGNEFMFVYYFVWKGKNFYRQSLTKSNFADYNAYISPNRDRYIFIIDAKNADNDEPIVNVYRTRNREGIIFSMTKVDLSCIDNFLGEQDNSGFVYMVTNPTLKDGIVKIGYSINWKQRIDSLYSGNSSVALPFHPICIIKVPNMAKAEIFFHKSYEGNRINGSREFFDFKDGINEAKRIFKLYADSVDGDVIMA